MLMKYFAKISEFWWHFRILEIGMEYFLRALVPSKEQKR